jgi:hypothetical protein
LYNLSFLDSVFPATPVQPQRRTIDLTHFTDAGTTKRLMTPMRDASIRGPGLRQAHRQSAQYIALQTLPTLLGLEEHSIQDVQNHMTTSHCIGNDTKTPIDIPDMPLE